MRAGLESLDLLEGTVPESYNRSKLVWLECIKDALHLYLDFGLRGKVRVTDFFDSYWYLFQIRSEDPSTWGDLKNIKWCFTEDGKRKKLDHTPTDKEIAGHCFDVHYELSGLANYCAMARFLNKIHSNREELVKLNRDKLFRYVSEVQIRDMKRIAPGRQIPLTLAAGEIERILVEPLEVAKFAELFYYPSALMKPPKMKSYRKLDAERFDSFWARPTAIAVPARPRAKHKLEGQIDILEDHGEQLLPGSIHGL